ncbi:DUF1203 domain-containing protein [Profundibacter sp.]
MSLTYLPYDPDWVASIRAGGPDAYGLPAERTVSDGAGKPCRNCLCDIPKGAEMLIMAARPFPDPQPYAETGPIFFCAGCAPYQGDDLPPVLATRKECLLKAYGTDNRIIYGTGQITPTGEIETYCEALLTDPKVAYVDARSASNNCFTLRIRRKNEPTV